MANTKSRVHTMTFDEYDQFLDQAAEVELFNLKPYWPTSGDIEMHQDKFTTAQLALMFTWLLENNGPPTTDAERRSYLTMKQYVYDHLKLVDEPS